MPFSDFMKVPLLVFVVYLSVAIPNVIDFFALQQSVYDLNFYSSEIQIIIGALTGVFIAITVLQATKVVVNQFIRGPKLSNQERILLSNVIVSGLATCGGLILSIIGHGHLSPDYFGVYIPWVFWLEWLVCWPLIASLSSFFTSVSKDSIFLLIISQFLMVVCGYFIGVDIPQWPGVVPWACAGACCVTGMVPVYLAYQASRESHLSTALVQYEEARDRVVLDRYDCATAYSILAAVSGCYLLVYVSAAMEWLDSDWTCLCFMLIGIMHRVFFSEFCSNVHATEGHESKQKADMAKRASEQKMSYLKFVFHEARVPLQSFSLGLRLLGGSAMHEEERRETLDMMSEAATFIADTFDDVLSIQKIQDGAMELKMEFFDMRRMVDGVVKSLRSPIIAKSLHFVLDISPELPEAIVGDRYRISHVIANFLSNAIKFSPENSTLTLRVSCENDMYTRVSDVLVEVIDQGLGISEEDQKQLFRAYMQVNAEEIQNGRGTGIGLSLCHHIITLHGGEVLCQSQVGVGSSFGFRLQMAFSDASALGAEDKDRGSVWKEGGVTKAAERPVKSVRLPRAGDAEREEELNSSFGRRRRSGRLSRKGVGREPEFMVLIVDDSADNKKLLRRLLHQRNISSDLVAGGREALRVLDKIIDRYDFIFMDNQMPDLNGVETVKRIRQMGYSNLVIGLTGCAFDEDRVAFLSSGADCVLTKPVDVQLLDRLLTFIGSEGPASRWEEGVGIAADVARAVGWSSVCVNR